MSIRASAGVRVRGQFQRHFTDLSCLPFSVICILKGRGGEKAQPGRERERLAVGPEKVGKPCARGEVQGPAREPVGPMARGRQGTSLLCRPPPGDRSFV